jgi:hypothetical protein
METSVNPASVPVSATATTAAAPRPCPCDQQTGSVLPALLVAAAVMIIVELVRAWLRRRRSGRSQAAE